MKLKKIIISNLFEKFNYEIDINNSEDLTIITSPNGYGKTIILNIIYNFFNNRLLFFYTLSFDKVVFELEDDLILELSRRIVKESTKERNHRFTEESKDNSDEFNRAELSIHAYHNGKEIDNVEYSYKHFLKIFSQIERPSPLFRKISPTQWIERNTDRILSTEEVLVDFISNMPEPYYEKYFPNLFKNDKVLKLYKEINVQLIKEQRLLRQTQDRYNERMPVFTNTIQEYAEELKDLIINTQSLSFVKSQELDSTFPKRLLEESGKITEDEFNNRFKVLTEKQEKLNKYGLGFSKQEVLNKYNQEDAKALLVYLNDSDKKITIFDNLLKRIELFTEILNERRFSFKSIVINAEQGFTFLTDTGKNLKLKDLSSGEQHEVVLLYELIFKSKQNTLVLIDEPEISLHISWQNEFLNDLMKIIRLQNIQVVIATHSPQIINDYWDLTVNLDKQIR